MHESTDRQVQHRRRARSFEGDLVQITHVVARKPQAGLTRYGPGYCLNDDVGAVDPGGDRWNFDHTIDHPSELSSRPLCLEVEETDVDRTIRHVPERLAVEEEPKADACHARLHGHRLDPGAFVGVGRTRQDAQVQLLRDRLAVL